VSTYLDSYGYHSSVRSQPKTARPLVISKAKLVALIWCVMAGMVAGAHAQGRGGAPPAAPPAPPPTPKAGAPIDITGYWVSLVTEDWRYRMAIPPKGDISGVPLNPVGRDAASAWDPAKDEEGGQQCKAYGVGGLMRMPGRLHITWQDDNTLKLEADAGAQTRILNFKPSQSQGGDWQGVSLASWERQASVMGPGRGGPPPGGSLKVVTIKMKPGYLRKNGVPYSADAAVTEYFERFDEPNGESLLLVITEVNDPAYLATPFWTSTHFKKQNDAAGWNPTPCSAQ
jgi:hypothetical protein